MSKIQSRLWYDILLLADKYAKVSARVDSQMFDYITNRHEYVTNRREPYKPLPCTTNNVRYYLTRQHAGMSRVYIIWDRQSCASIEYAIKELMFMFDHIPGVDFVVLTSNKVLNSQQKTAES